MEIKLTEQPQQMKKVVDILTESCINKLYGKVVVTIQNGKMVACNRDESIKLSE